MRRKNPNGFLYIEPADYIPKDLRKKYRLGEYNDKFGPVPADEITLEEAKAIAGKQLQNISGCVEFSNAFCFTNAQSETAIGGPDAPVFVLKENGGLIPFSVIRSESVAAEDISGLETIVNQFENALALVTCENERSSGGYADRRVVIAIPD